MDRSAIGIVIPALNEAATINAVVTATQIYGRAIVVDDGSADETASEATKAGAIVVSHAQNKGYDQALNSGFKKAADIGCKLIITLDADGQHNPALLSRFIEKIEQGADVVVGVRSNRQRVAEHLFAWYTNVRFGIKDPLCGMKAYSVDVYKELGHFDTYSSIGTELVIFAAKHQYKIEQLEFVVKDRQDASRFGASLSANYRILRAMLLSLG